MRLLLNKLQGSGGGVQLHNSGNLMSANISVRKRGGQKEERGAEKETKSGTCETDSKGEAVAPGRRTCAIFLDNKR